MFYLIKPGTQIDFVKHRHLWAGLSLVAVLASLVLFFTKGLNYGIDFTGGAELHLSVPAEWDTAKLRDALEKGGISNPKVVKIDHAERNEFLVRAQGDDQSLNQVSGKVSEILSRALPSGGFDVLRSDIVGPAAGNLLRIQGFLAMFYALLVILVYVAVRFEVRYAPGAVLALFHDSLICVGIFVLTGKQFDLTILAAILALIGYSNNDTIIVYDRVRETSHLHPELTIEQAVNRAINETLGRTINTTVTTFLVVFALWMYGGPVIENFAFTLLVGLVVGAYSSIFVASSVIIFATNYQRKKQLSAHQPKSGKKAPQLRAETKAHV